MFRFHTGSIKRITIIIAPREPDAFRFHTGSIKRCRLAQHCWFRLDGFDSILVRLKVEDIAHVVYTRIRFDSILVRLKAFGWENEFACEEFRFHTGSIKRQAATTGEELSRVSIPYWFD